MLRVNLQHKHSVGATQKFPPLPCQLSWTFSMGHRTVQTDFSQFSIDVHNFMQIHAKAFTPITHY